MGDTWEKGVGRFLAYLDRLRLRRGRLVAAVSALLVLAGAAALPGLLTGEDARVLIPDRPARLAGDFDLLSRAPLARRAFILLTAGPGTPAEALDAAADELAARLGPPDFRAFGLRPEGTAFLAGLLDAAPCLVTPEELRAWAGSLSPDEVRRRLGEVRQALGSPQGAALKAVLRQDPLRLRDLLFAKLPRLNAGGAGPDAKGRLRSPDGRSLVLTAATDIPFTDAAGAERLLAGFAQAARESLPEGVSGVLVSGHRHSLANARTIKADLGWVLPLSTVALALVVFGFLRNRGAVWVMLVPLAVLGLAGAATGLLFGGLHGIVFGFGGVLMGMAVDYPVHVQHVLRQEGDPSRALARVGRPLWYGVLTSVAAFAALLFSEVPAIRQMAVFSMLGLAASLPLSLMVLPQLLRTGGPVSEAPPAPPARPPRARGLVLAVWAVGFCALVWASLGLRINPQIAALGVVDPAVQADENRVRAALGGLQDRAMVFAAGADLGQAEQANARVLAILGQSPAGAGALSLARLLPPPEEQAHNRAAWGAAWAGGAAAGLAREVLAAGKDLGFTEPAFAPFLERLGRWGEGALPPPVEPEDLERLGLGEAVGLLVQKGPEGASLLTLLPDATSLETGLEERLEAVPGVRVVSGAGFARDLGAALRHDYLFFVGLSLALVAGLIVLFCPQPRTAIAVLAPICTGMAAVTAGARLAQGGLNLFNVVALPLIVGLASDYGIFMASRSQGACDTADRPVLVCGLTTLAGFGGLAVAQHPALRALGLSILLGIGAALPTALLVTPRLLGNGEGPEKMEAHHAE